MTNMKDNKSNKSRYAVSPHSKTKYHTGVALIRAGYKAELQYKGERYYLGVWDTAEKAARAYRDKHREIWGQDSPYYGQEEEEIKEVIKEEGQEETISINEVECIKEESKDKRKGKRGVRKRAYFINLQ